MVNFLLLSLFGVFLFLGVWKLVRWPLKFFLTCFALLCLSTCVTSFVDARRSAPVSGLIPPASPAPDTTTPLPDSLREAALGH
jgi:hypothetical protein